MKSEGRGPLHSDSVGAKQLKRYTENPDSPENMEYACLSTSSKPITVTICG